MHVAKSLRLILFVSPKWNLLYVLLAQSLAADKKMSTLETTLPSTINFPSSSSPIHWEEMEGYGKKVKNEWRGKKWRVLRRIKTEQKRVMNNDKDGVRESETRDRVLLKCCFRLMAHFLSVRETLFGSQSKWGWLVYHSGNRWDNGHRYDIEV